MAIADWIREANERRRQKLRQEGFDRGYVEGYADRDAGKPSRYPGNTADKPRQPDDNEPGRSE